MTLLLLSLLTERTYHQVALADVARSSWTHICTIGIVLSVRRQPDGDWHLLLAAGPARLIAEVIPLIPIARPPIGVRVEVCGITRRDRRHHNQAEIHPVEQLTVLP